MSRWAPDSSTPNENQGTPPESDSGGVSLSSGNGPAAPLAAERGTALPRWMRVVPFFLSALLFLSALFSVFSPLPILVLRMQGGKRWAALAALTNLAIVGALGGAPSALIYLIFVVTLSFAMSGFLLRQKRIEKTVASTLLSMALVAALVIAAYSLAKHINPWTELRQQVSTAVDYVVQTISSRPGAAPAELPSSPAEMDEWKQSLMVEFPSAVAVFSLVLVWLNLVILLRMNPRGLRQRLGLDPQFMKKWKSPDYLIWPTILSGFFLIYDLGLPSDIALNLFKFLMAIYAIHGLSILGFFFDLWNVRGLFRTLGYLVAIFLMMPLLLSLGFFDLWFDFRAKFRQSS